ncbi:hypothetical protein D3C71_1519790 [compost metagenome]
MRQPRRGRVLRTHHHAHPLRCQLAHLPAAWPRRLSEQQDRIQALLLGGEAPVLGGPMQRQLGQGGLQRLQAGNHPARQDAAAAAEHQRFGPLLALDRHYRLADLLEGAFAGGLQILTSAGQAQPTPFALEQHDAEVFLQQAQLAADRAMGDMQCLGGTANPAQPGGRFKAAQGIERGQRSVGHVSFPDRSWQILSIFLS